MRVLVLALLLALPFAAGSHAYRREADLHIEGAGTLDGAPVLVTFHGRYYVSACSNALWAYPVDQGGTLVVDGVAVRTFPPGDFPFASGITTTGADETWMTEDPGISFAMAGNAEALAAAGFADLPQGELVFSGVATFGEGTGRLGLGDDAECFVDW